MNPKARNPQRRNSFWFAPDLEPTSFVGLPGSRLKGVIGFRVRIRF